MIMAAYQIIKSKKKEKKINKETYHRFGIDDKTQEKIKPHLVDQPEQHDDVAKDNRNFINAVV